MARYRATGPRYSAPLANRGWQNRLGELKYIDLGAFAYAGDTTGSLTVLNSMAQGADVTTRVGRQIYNRSIHVHGNIQPQDTSTSPTYTRVMLIWDNQPNNSVATVTDILTSSTSLSMTNLNNRERFEILRDQKFSFGGFESRGGEPPYSMTPNTATVNMYVNLKNRKTTFSSSSAGNTISTGALLLLTIGNTTTGNGVTGNLISRLRFYDD